MNLKSLPPLFHLEFPTDLEVAHAAMKNTRDGVPKPEVVLDRLRRWCSDAPEPMPVPEGAAGLGRGVITLRKLLSYDHRTLARYVYRATMAVHDSDSSLNATPLVTIDVVVKFGYHKPQHEPIRAEAKIYETKLGDIMGQCVPHCFGVFCGNTYEGMTTVLVLEDGGEGICRPLRCQPIAFKQAVVDALLRIHKAGIAYGSEVTEKSVVFKRDTADGSTYTPMFIDFSAAVEHKCGFESNAVSHLLKAYIPEPRRAAFPCVELWNVCYQTQFWMQTHWWFGNYIISQDAVNEEWLLTLVPDDEMAREKERVFQDVESLSGAAREWVEKHDRWDQLPPH
ncbi:hypothetical protein FKP32DRAFT_1586931 [Trametes sanguinea]|nr:hypothetical protein FKP32DRAFT_1586931 [Trametes sanguinea]